MDKDIDLDINNYQYLDLLNIFGLPKDYNDNTNENIHIMKNKINLIKENFSHKIYRFFNISFKIISIIYSLHDNDIIINMNEINNIDYYLNEIKKNKLYENHEFSEIIKIFKKSNTSYNKKYTFLENKNSNPDTKSLNEVNYNTQTLNPSLNNKNKTNEIVNNFSNIVAPGDLNSIKRLTQLQNLYLNSCFRHNYYNSNPTDFQYIIPSEVKNVLSMRLVSIEIPNAWYLFSNNSKNNFFRIETHIEDVTNSYDICIPNGNYDYETLQNYLNSTFFYESETETDLKYIKFYIDSCNFKSYFELVNEPNNMKFSLYFLEQLNQNVMNTFGWTLGFRIAKYLYVEDKLESEGLYDGGGDRYIYISVNDYQYNSNNLNIVGFDKSILNEDILAKIPMINGKLSLIIDDNNNPLSKTRRYNGPVNLSRLHIKILDKFGNVINLNNMDYSFTLEMELLYESFNFNNVTY